VPEKFFIKNKKTLVLKHYLNLKSNIKYCNWKPDPFSEKNRNIFEKLNKK
jgi:hypothetical protein